MGESGLHSDQTVRKRDKEKGTGVLVVQEGRKEGWVQARCCSTKSQASQVGTAMDKKTDQETQQRKRERERERERERKRERRFSWMGELVLCKKVKMSLRIGAVFLARRAPECLSGADLMMGSFSFCKSATTDFFSLIVCVRCEFSSCMFLPLCQVVC